MFFPPLRKRTKRADPLHGFVVAIVGFVRGHEVFAACGNPIEIVLVATARKGAQRHGETHRLARVDEVIEEMIERRFARCVVRLLVLKSIGNAVCIKHARIAVKIVGAHENCHVFKRRVGVFSEDRLRDPDRPRLDTLRTPKFCVERACLDGAARPFDGESVSLGIVDAARLRSHRMFKNRIDETQNIRLGAEILRQ